MLPELLAALSSVDTDCSALSVNKIALIGLYTKCLYRLAKETNGNSTTFDVQTSFESMGEALKLG